MLPPNRTLTFLTTAAAAAAAAPVSNQTIHWGDCTSDLQGPIPVDCGKLDVPLDYTGKYSQKDISLDLLRARAPVQPSKGSIILNFGGPGGDGRAELSKIGPILQLLSASQYDLVAFDPRGTAETVPFVCYDDEVDLAMSYTNQLLADYSDPVTFGRVWAQGALDAKACAKAQNETGRFIDTVTTAKDVMSVVDALGGDKLLRYWGMSYGTTLGATLVSMFPERVERVLLDGVQNPHEYYHGKADFEGWEDADVSFSGVFVHCVKNPDKCQLARGNATAQELEDSVWQLVDELRTHPIPVGNAIIDYSFIHTMFIQSTYATSYWPTLTAVLDQMLRKDYSDAFVEQVSLLNPTNGTALRPNLKSAAAFYGIHCLDRNFRTNDPEEFDSLFDQFNNISRVAGGVATGVPMYCAQWQMDPPERYTGSFQAKARKPVLLVGNTWDGHTPLKSAYNVSAGFEDSVVLEVRGYGHCSTSLPSVCSVKAQSSYWVNGTLPEKNTVCEVDAPPFSTLTWADITAMVSGNNAITGA